MIKDAASDQPSWLAGWFSFWTAITSSNSAFYVYSTGLLEVALALCLIFGFMHRLSGPYGPSSSDIGTGIVYALVSLMLLLINATFGPSRHSLDFLIEKKWSRWKKIAEIKSH